MPLTDVAIRNAKGGEKPRKLTDGEGLYLLIRSDSQRYWRFDYRFQGKRKTLAIGTYPEVSLAEARRQRDLARETVANGRDPSLVKRRERQAAKVAAGNTFEIIAASWLQTKVIGQGRADRTIAKAEWLLTFINPTIGARPIMEITAPDLLDVLRRVEGRGHLETARRMRSTMSRIFRFAIASGLAERDPAADLQGALASPNVTHHGALFDPKQVGALLRAIDGYDGTPMTHAALKLAPLVFLRPGELRMAEWSEIDLDHAEWRIPAAKMKMRLPHIVPLSTQAIEILRSVRPFTDRSRYIFSSLRTGDRPMSENTINAAFRRLGFTSDEQTAHGLRRTASTLLNEQGWNRDWIEAQLAHTERDQVRAAYNAAQYLHDRRRMMQAWADYLDVLKGEDDIASLIG